MVVLPVYARRRCARGDAVSPRRASAGAQCFIVSAVALSHGVEWTHDPQVGRKVTHRKNRSMLDATRRGPRTPDRIAPRVIPFGLGWRPLGSQAPRYSSPPRARCGGGDAFRASGG